MSATGRAAGRETTGPPAGWVAMAAGGRVASAGKGGGLAA